MGKQRESETEQPAESVPLVTGANGKTRRAMAGDEVRPKCYRCSTEDHAVFYAAISTRPYYTFYQCPVCHDRTKLARYDALQRMQRRQPPENYSAR